MLLFIACGVAIAVCSVAVCTYKYGKFDTSDEKKVRFSETNNVRRLHTTHQEFYPRIDDKENYQQQNNKLLCNLTPTRHGNEDFVVRKRMGVELSPTEHQASMNDKIKPNDYNTASPILLRTKSISRETDV